jgi:hypothetical protein
MQRPLTHFDLSGSLLLRNPGRPGIQYDVDPTAPARSPQVQTGDDQFYSLSNRACRTRAISHDPVVSLAYFVAVPVRACGSGWCCDRANRYDLEGIRQIWRFRWCNGRVAYHGDAPDQACSRLDLREGRLPT